jgi:hypothetical protein
MVNQGKNTMRLLRILLKRILKDYEVDEKAIDVYRELGNQWDSASCLAEVNNLLLLKYFQEKQK